MNAGDAIDLLLIARRFFNGIDILGSFIAVF